MLGYHYLTLLVHGQSIGIHDVDGLQNNEEEPDCHHKEEVVLAPQVNTRVGPVLAVVNVEESLAVGAGAREIDSTRDDRDKTSDEEKTNGTEYDEGDKGAEGLEGAGDSDTKSTDGHKVEAEVHCVGNKEEEESKDKVNNAANKHDQRMRETLQKEGHHDPDHTKDETNCGVEDAPDVSICLCNLTIIFTNNNSGRTVAVICGAARTTRRTRNICFRATKELSKRSTRSG